MCTEARACAHVYGCPLLDTCFRFCRCRFLMVFLCLLLSIFSTIRELQDVSSLVLYYLVSHSMDCMYLALGVNVTGLWSLGHVGKTLNFLSYRFLTLRVTTNLFFRNTKEKLTRHCQEQALIQQTFDRGRLSTGRWAINQRRTYEYLPVQFPFQSQQAESFASKTSKSLIKKILTVKTSQSEPDSPKPSCHPPLCVLVANSASLKRQRPPPPRDATSATRRCSPRACAFSPERFKRFFKTSSKCPEKSNRRIRSF